MPGILGSSGAQGPSSSSSSSSWPRTLFSGLLSSFFPAIRVSSLSANLLLRPRTIFSRSHSPPRPQTGFPRLCAIRRLPASPRLLNSVTKPSSHLSTALLSLFASRARSLSLLVSLSCVLACEILSSSPPLAIGSTPRSVYCVDSLHLGYGEIGFSETRCGY